MGKRKNLSANKRNIESRTAGNKRTNQRQQDSSPKKNLYRIKRKETTKKQRSQGRKQAKGRKRADQIKNAQKRAKKQAAPGKPGKVSKQKKGCVFAPFYTFHALTYDAA
jgi:hypothetical protein